MTHQPVPLLDLAAQRAHLEPGLSAAIARVLDHGQFIMGPEVTALEQRLVDFTGAGHAVTCANGTDALVLVMMAEGIGPGDAVIVPSFTFVATAEAVALRGAVPVFADVDTRSYNVDPHSVERAIGHALPRGEVETIAGLLIAQRGALPAEGDTVVIDLPTGPAELVADEPVHRRIEVDVLDIERHVPTGVRVRLIELPAADAVPVSDEDAR